MCLLYYPTKIQYTAWNCPSSCVHVCLFLGGWSFQCLYIVFLYVHNIVYIFVLFSLSAIYFSICYAVFGDHWDNTETILTPWSGEINCVNSGGSGWFMFRGIPSIEKTDDIIVTIIGGPSHLPFLPGGNTACSDNHNVGCLVISTLFKPGKKSHHLSIYPRNGAFNRKIIEPNSVSSSQPCLMTGG